MSHHAQSTSSEGPAEPPVPEPSRSTETLHPPKLPERQRGQAPPTVRVISASEGAERKAEIDPAIASPDARRQAAERFERARVDHAAACNRLGAAARAEATAQRRADMALAAYEEARNEARRATVALRQRQRDASSTKLAVRRALEWLARLETLDEFPLTDSDVIDLRTSSSDGGMQQVIPDQVARDDGILSLVADSNGHSR